MSAMKSNGLLKFGVPVAVVLLLGMGLYAMKGTSNNNIKTNPDGTIYDLTDEERRELNLADGDTPQDTIKTLVSEMKKAKEEMQQVKSDNTRLLNENRILQSNSDNINQQIEDAINQKSNEIEAELERKLHEFTKTTQPETSTTPTPQSPGKNDIPIGLGLDGERLPGTKNLLSGSGDIGSTGLSWIDPDDVQYVDDKGNIVPPGTQNAKLQAANPFKLLDDSVLGKAADDISTRKSGTLGERDKPTIKPIYTIPKNSILTGSTAMTALIGRVPIEGAVTDPFPFKIMIGKENLMANGIDLPDVEGAIVSGTASGDWTLSCVKGKVEDMTFIFSDGRVRTLPDTGNNSGSSESDKGIGWLSNPEGVPCISGVRKSNAASYLSSQFLLSGASAAAQGLAQGQTTTVVDGGSVIGAVTGNQGKYILGQALGGGLNETAEWLRARYGQMFDAVYVPPGQAVAVHITKSLDIDYDTGARKVKYQTAGSKTKLD